MISNIPVGQYSCNIPKASDICYNGKVSENKTTSVITSFDQKGIKFGRGYLVWARVNVAGYYAITSGVHPTITSSKSARDSRVKMQKLKWGDSINIVATLHTKYLIPLSSVQHTFFYLSTINNTTIQYKNRNIYNAEVIFIFTMHIIFHIHHVTNYNNMHNTISQTSTIYTFNDLCPFT